MGAAAKQLLDQTCISEVWAALGGGKLRHGRGQAWWRKGDGWSVSICDEKDAWYDHRDGSGGGILSLICQVRGGSRRDALHWWAEMRGVTLDSTPLSLADRRRYAHARQQAPALARAASLWCQERCAELDELKQQAIQRSDMLALIEPAKEHYRLSILAPEGVIHAYQQAKRKWPKHTAALLAVGENWKRVSESLLTLLIADWAEDAPALDRWENEGGRVI